jgi:hypothetical protein
MRREFMNKDEILKLSNEVANLKEAVEIFQQNINNNISWFLSGLGLMIAIVGASLIILVRFLVDKRVEKELEIIDQRIKKGIEENPQIRWARGSIGGINLDTNKVVEVYNLSGPIYWQYPTTFLQLQGIRSKRKLDYKIISEFPNGFIAEVPDYDKQIDGVSVEWTVIWERAKE